MQPVLRISRDIDIRGLRQALWAQRIGHRISEEDEALVIWLADPGQHEAFWQLVERWRRGEPLDVEPPARARGHWKRGALAEAPVAAGLVGMCVIVFALMALLGDRVLAWLMITPVSVVGNAVHLGSLGETLASGQVWRLFTPVLLHFGWMHLIFNMLWLWYFGRQVESLNGARRLALVVVIGAVGSNLAQYATGTVLFGGMSGVDYALLGYVWLMSRRRPSSGFFVPQMLVVFMLGWMVFTMTDFAEPLGFGNVANEAHLGGLLLGLAFGGWASRKKRAG
ncbi:MULTISPECIES: rhomboid family intramembrane serine protease [unclassified Modicisalibacter]|uniref:rhomboid family intramembrane serine protease n=1 Tax=unclassified Modicisalibacter TaxID=2679913 RepID=UPI001CD0357E|nr:MULTISPECIES: rhomboid family intramembrane serine protease [unclassified Modicisalibacter]MBZ9560084.1 rhomboid family intramembrane serine protease [Modicisalibacter sp. R2A 31.J]MBZ9575993.1 rhomboid family intramembrane serine protease [Modicisalibacter sp. MOD 31.J]